MSFAMSSVNEVRLLYGIMKFNREFADEKKIEPFVTSKFPDQGSLLYPAWILVSWSFCRNHQKRRRDDNGWLW